MGELNLIPVSLKSSREKRNKNQNILYVIIIIIAIMFFGVYFPYMQLDRLQKDEADYKNQVNAQINVIQERDRILSFINSTNDLASKVESFDKSRIFTYDIITQLQQYTPGDVSMNSINYTKDAITIAGTSKTYNGAAIFAANLQESDLFQKAKLVSVNKDQGKTYSFSVNIDMKR